MMTHTERNAYLKRLGITDIQPPSLAYLFEIHRAHVQFIPWQTIDIVAGKPVPIDTKKSVNLMISSRSGYCFHLNGAFGELLRSLGYKVSWHRAGVQPMGQEPRINSFHLGLTVSLTNEQEEEQRWIIDAGLGDMPYEPLPLQMGSYEQGPFYYQVTPSSVAQNGWRLVHDPHASFVGVDFAPEVVENLTEFVPKHEFYSRSADSPWINLFLVRNRHATGNNEIRGCIWSKREGITTEKTELRTKSQWLEVLGDVFQEHLVTYSKQEQDDLWKRVQHLHEEWKKAKGA
ncbi:arylamine N-acetyltransferase family protein [Brevibacillus choshinensis]|uniref:arylamine N-acetyltransferase family protein n=1 Tax=Brevibacillus choshinensis TaxID=54911 RepID=UPI002E1E05F5|nr:arylamine N-acetyltransferase [Brevibacillus choshinensis]MED4782017.1 arylamine N-acetyltransferase [Brevibacillus choshinensis]